MQSTQVKIGDLRLQGGAVLPGVELATTTSGTLAPDGRNAILLTHGYTSSHMMAGVGNSEGPWSELVGPGKAIDTDRFFVVSSNMLGSSYGSTAPGSRNPATGREYGPDFPEISVTDIVTAQKALLDTLGVKHLVAVVGPSYGGFQAFQWAVTFPDAMDAIIPVVSSPRRPNRSDITTMETRFARDPNWNGGWHYEKGGIPATMAALREETLRRYGAEQELAARFPDAGARNAEIRRRAAAWGREFDPHSLMVLGRAANAYDVWDQLGNIRARVLYVLSRTDVLFPPSLAETVMPALAKAGVDARYVEIDSEHGHLASGTDAAKWSDALRAFLDEVSEARKRVLS